MLIMLKFFLMDLFQVIWLIIILLINLYISIVTIKI